MVFSLLPGGEKWREAPDEGMLLAPRLPHRPLIASHALGTSPGGEKRRLWQQPSVGMPNGGWRG